MAKFDRDGQYKESIELTIDYPLFRMAVLPSGEFLVTGYDQPNNTQRLILLDAGGRVVRPLDLFSLAQRSEKKPGPNESQDYLMAKSVASIEFVARGESVLMWKRGTNDPVFELRAGGSVREVPIAAPKGYVLSDLVPSDDVWLAHFRPSSVSDDAASDSNLALYYEVMPLDGSLLRRLVSKSGQPSQIACKSKGIYLSYETDEKSRLVEMVAR